MTCFDCNFMPKNLNENIIIRPSKYQYRHCQVLSIIKKKSLTEQLFKHDSAHVSMYEDKACFTWNDGSRCRHYFRLGIGTHKITTVEFEQHKILAQEIMRMIPASWNFDSLTAESRHDKNGQKGVLKETITGSLHSFFPTTTPFSQIKHSYFCKPITYPSLPKSLGQAMSVLTISGTLSIYFLCHATLANGWLIIHVLFSSLLRMMNVCF